MKKLLLVIVLVCSMNLFSLDHGLISGFEVGRNIIDHILITDTILIDNKDSISLTLKTGYRIENLRVIGTYENKMMFDKLDNFIPFRDSFKIEINYTFKYFKIGMLNECIHPVTTQSDNRDVFVNIGQRSIYISFYREF